MMNTNQSCGHSSNIRDYLAAMSANTKGISTLTKAHMLIITPDSLPPMGAGTNSALLLSVDTPTS